MRVRAKICCISSLEEAALAMESGADALGLVGAMPSGPGSISDALIRQIASSVPPPIATFLLTQETSGQAIAEHVQACGVNTVQIVQHIDPAEYPHLIQRIPHIKRVQVIHVENDGALRLIETYLPYVDAFLLDSGRPSAAVPELGGTGRVHDWRISRRFVQSSAKPVFLAGGLSPQNLREALLQVSPFGVDICSGVRTGGHLDASKLSAFFQALPR
jgi:phosphoribosylanthranilate isomerase